MGYCDCPNKVGRLDYTDKRYLLIHSVALMMELFGQYREIHLLPNTIGLSPAGAVANIVNREEFTWSEVYYLHYYCAKIGVPKPWDVSTCLSLFPARRPQTNQIRSQLARHTDGLDPEYPNKDNVWEVSFSLWFQARDRFWAQDYSTVPYSFTPYKGNIK